MVVTVDQVSSRKLEDNLNFLGMEDDLNYFGNRRRPHIFWKWKMTYISVDMEDDHNLVAIVGKIENNLNVKVNGRWPQF